MIEIIIKIKSKCGRFTYKAVKLVSYTKEYDFEVLPLVDFLKDSGYTDIPISLKRFGKNGR